MSSLPAYIHIADQIKSQWLSNSDLANGTKLPTQERLSRQFGVSRATIVRALSKLVAEGYLNSQQGSGVYVAEVQPRDTQVQRISLIVSDLHAPVIIQACRGVERRARQLGYQVLLASSEGHLEHEQELAQQHLQAGAQGIVIYPVTREKADMPTDYLTNWKHDIPVVAMDIGCEEWPCTRVHFDNYRLGYDMAQLLQRHGHRHIAFMHIAPETLHNSIHDREKGWEAAMQEAGTPIPTTHRNWTEGLSASLEHPLSDADYEQIARTLLELEPRPDALIAWNDVVAAHLIQTLLNLGARIPDDIRIAGFDNEPLITRLFRPLFPTSRPDFARLGELAVNALHGILGQENRMPRIYYYPVSALWRETRTATTYAGEATESEDFIAPPDSIVLAPSAAGIR